MSLICSILGDANKPPSYPQYVLSCFMIWGVSALLHLVPLLSKCPPSGEVVKGHPVDQIQPTEDIIVPPKEFPKLELIPSI